jgi:hypothetical protein
MNKLRKLTVVIAMVACIALFSGVASATPACSSVTGVTIATELNPLGSPSTFECSAGGLVFDMFSLNAPNPTPGIDQGFQINGVSVVGGAVNLLFQLTPGLANTTGITIFYRVSGYQIGFDVELGGNPVSRIIEDVCRVQFTGISGVCVDPNPATPANENILASYTANNNTISGFLPFTQPVTVAYFKKDLSVAGNGSFSDFVNSHHVPEPGTYAMMGVGLLGLAFLKRKRTTN